MVGSKTDLFPVLRDSTCSVLEMGGGQVVNSCTHRLPHSLAHLWIRSLTDLLVQAFIHSFDHSFVRCCLLSHLLTHPRIIKLSALSVDTCFYRLRGAVEAFEQQRCFKVCFRNISPGQDVVLC